MGWARRAVIVAKIDLSLQFHEAKARVVDDFERAYIAGVLEAHGGKVGLAAKHAGLDPKNFSAKAARYRGFRVTSSADFLGGRPPIVAPERMATGVLLSKPRIDSLMQTRPE